MLGTIESIAEVKDVAKVRNGYSTSMDGYVVHTDAHTFEVLIDNEQSCCESRGYLTSEDALDPFVGAQLREVQLTDSARNVTKVKESHQYEDAGGIQFVDFVTDRDVFQLAVYNGHNGCYGHEILIQKDDVVLADKSL